MRKFTQIKESQEQQKSYVSIVEFVVITRATSDEEATANIEKICEVAKKTNTHITRFNMIDLRDLISDNFTDFSAMESVSENTMCVNNTKKMMDDYLKNTGAKTSDQHYVNLEKILKVFQTGPQKTIKLESKQDVDVEQMTNDICDVKKEDLDDAIKAVEDLMKEFKDKDGDTNNQQYANLEDMKKALNSYKKDLKCDEAIEMVKESAITDYSLNYTKEEIYQKCIWEALNTPTELENMSEEELRLTYNKIVDKKNKSWFDQLNRK